jgi:uridine phosphorylase
METAAIYGLGKLLGHRCLSVNVILANRIHNTFSRNPVKAIEKMIEQSLEIITQ